MNADLLVAPTDLVAAAPTSADDFDCQPAYAATYHADRHLADPALRAKHEHTEAARARDNAQRRADAVAKGYAAPCQCCSVLTRVYGAALTPAGAVLCGICAPVVCESAAPVTPSAPVAPAPAARPVAAERGAVPVAALPAGVELRRLAKAATLTVERLGTDQYRVSGGAGVHEVDLNADGAAGPRCPCGDSVYRGDRYLCAHTLRAMAERAAPADASLVAALAVLRGLVAAGALTAALEPRAAAPARRAA